MTNLFNLFRHLSKRTKIEPWEVDLLRRVFELLPDDYSNYRRQVKDGLIVGVLLSENPSPNYVNFTFDPRISKKYENENERFFCLKNIVVFEAGEPEPDEVEIYATHGLVCGYRFPKERKNKLDIAAIDVGSFKKEFLDNLELELMRSILTEDEIELLNPSDFYEVVLDGKEYYHVRDLEDGDFIGIDRNRKVYRITHDPYEIQLCDGDIRSNLSKY